MINKYYEASIDLQDGNGARDITQYLLVDTNHIPVLRNRSIYNDQKPNANTCKISIGANKANYNNLLSLYQLIISNTKDILISITTSSNGTTYTPYFTGIIRPTWSDQTSLKLDQVNFECIDYWYYLTYRKTINQIGYYGYAVSNPANKAQSILHQLFYAAGISDSQLNLPTISTTLPAFVVKELSVLGEVIQKLLFEYCYTVYVDAAGIFQSYYLAPTSASSSVTISPANANLLGLAKGGRQEAKYEAVDITYTTTVTLSQTIIHNDTTNNTGSSLPSGATCGIAISSGTYYPTGASSSQDVYANYQVPNYTLIAVNPSTTSLVWNNYTGSITNSQFSAEQTRAKIKFTSASSGILYILQVKGDAVCQGDTSVISYENVAGTFKREGITLNYVFDSTNANAFMSMRASYQRNSIFRYAIETNNFSINPGDYVTYNNTLLGINQLCRVYSASDGGSLEYQNLILEGFAAITLQTPTGVKNTQTSVPTQPVATIAQLQNGSTQLNVNIVGGQLAGVNVTPTTISLGSGSYNSATTPFYIDNSGRFSLKQGLAFDGTNLSISGNVAALTGTLTNLTVNGTITVGTGGSIVGTGYNLGPTSSTIAAFTISASTISATNLVLTSGAANTANITVGTGATAGGLGSPAASGDIAIWAGSTFANRATAAFRVTAGGVLNATGATISGAITATSGSFTGSITTSSLTATGGTLSTLTVNGTITVGTGGSIVGTGYNFGPTTSTIAGLTIATNKMYYGTGIQGSSLFYVDSSGNFNLGTSLVWTASTSTLSIAGNFNLSGGVATIAGWILNTNTLASAASGARVEIDSTLDRVSIYDSSALKVVLGYLSGRPKNGNPYDNTKAYAIGQYVYYATTGLVYKCILASTGNLPTNTTYWSVSSDTYTTSDYGLWLANGNNWAVSGGITNSGGDLITSDGNFKILNNAVELVRVGSDNGTIGLHLYNASTPVDLYNSGNAALEIKTVNGTLSVGPRNASYCHFYTSVPAYYFDKYITVNGAIQIYGSTNGFDGTGKAKVLSGVGTVSNTVYIKDSNSQLAERTINDGVWTYNYNQSLLTSASPSFVRLTSTQATGTSPFVVASTTVVTNLNADMVDGYSFNQSLQTTDSPSFVKLTSTQATGTAPFIVASTTKVANLNADMVDGYTFNQSLQTTDKPTFAGYTINASAAAGSYQAQIVGASGAARDLLLVGVNTISNGFTVQYNFTNNSMQYSFLNGNVGLGVSNWTYRLTVQAAAAGYIAAFTDGTEMANFVTGTGFSAIGSKYNDFRIYAADSSTNGIQIKGTTGDVGIGLSPSYRLDVSGTTEARFVNTTARGSIFIGDATDATYSPGIQMQYSYLTTTWNKYIRLGSNGTLDVVNSAYNTVLCQISDLGDLTSIRTIQGQTLVAANTGEAQVHAVYSGGGGGASDLYVYNNGTGEGFYDGTYGSLIYRSKLNNIVYINGAVSTNSSLDVAGNTTSANFKVVVSAGSNYFYSYGTSGTNSTVYAAIANYSRLCRFSGTVNVNWSIAGSGVYNVYTKVYVNGSPYSAEYVDVANSGATHSVAVTINDGDTITLYGHASPNCNLGYFQIGVAQALTGVLGLMAANY